MSDLHHRVSQFLYREAWLADTHAFAEWLALWAPDATYYIPCNEDEADPEEHVAIIYERLQGLEDRVRRLSGGFAYAQEPRSRLSRVIGNIALQDGAGELVEVRSTFNLTAFRRDTIDIFAGRQVHRLRPDGDDFQIVSKTVHLINNDGYIANMSFLV